MHIIYLLELDYIAIIGFCIAATLTLVSKVLGTIEVTYLLLLLLLLL